MPVHTMESDEDGGEVISKHFPLLLIFFAPNYALPAVPQM